MRQIVAFTGFAGSGKSTAAMHLVAEHGFARVRFAGPLKAMMAALGLCEREIEGDLKETPCALLGGASPRHAMQTLGTQWGRDLIGTDLWVRAWRAAVEREPAGKPVVVDDCRFPNEARAINDAGGMLVRIARPEACVAWLDRPAHVSEAHVADMPAVLTLENLGTVSDLKRQVDGIVLAMSWARAAADEIAAGPLAP